MSNFFDRVDSSRLKRDYSKLPLKRGERLDKEELSYLFFELNFSAELIGTYINKNHATVSYWLADLGYKKNQEQLHKSKVVTLEYKYGKVITNPYDVPGARKKCKETCLSKYGVKHHLSSKNIQDKRKETCLLKYGVDNAAKNKTVQEKVKKTNLKRYGTVSPIQNKNIKEKIAATCQNKYNAPSVMESDYYKQKCKDFLNTLGVDNISQVHVSKETRDILSNKDKFKQFIINSGYKVAYKIGELLGVSATPILQKIHEYGLEDIVETFGSSIEEEISNLFPTIKFHKDRTILEGREIDLYSDKHKIGIEFNGNYWHSDKFEPNKKYHQKKSLDALKKGVFIYHIWEYEWHDPRTRQAIINQLCNIFGLNQNKIYARNCEIREVQGKEALDFFDKNHVQGKTYSGIKLGLYHKGELVSLMCFAHNSINKNYEYELNRFCSKAGYNVVGGASKLFKHFIKAYNPKSIISYSDIAKTTGNIYKVLGFTQSHMTEPQYHWTNGTKVLSRYKTQLKHLVRAGWKKEDSTQSEDEVMRAHGFAKLYDCGKIAWVRNNVLHIQ